MAATRKRAHSIYADHLAEVAPCGATPSAAPATVKRSKLAYANGSDSVVRSWQHDWSVTEIDGDAVDPEWFLKRSPPHAPAALDCPFILRTGASRDVRVAPRLPLAGSQHALAQALANRHSALRYYIGKDRFRFRRTLNGHLSCVNALAFSRDQGRWLASGGDDCEIHIRDMFVDLTDEAQTVPLAILKGHQSNIFSLSWSAQNKYLFSTGNDSQILYYDVEHSNLPIRGQVPSAPEPRSPLNASSLGGHDDSVPELSAHPTNANVLLSCDDGGNLKLIDIRIPHEGVATARSDNVAGFSSVQWNPNASDGNTFAAATCGRITGSTRLYDVRQCFSSDQNRPLSSEDAVLSYHTALMQNSSARGLIAAAAETNSVCFDPNGRFLASSISRYHPTIYAVNDPDPLVTLESTVADDPVKDQYYDFFGYPHGTPAAPKKLSSCCTIKHGSFGLEAHTGKLHYAIGSDDFRAYVFEIPSKDELVRQREFVGRSDWLHETSRLHQERRQHKLKEAGSTVPPAKSAPEAESNAFDDDDSDLDMVSEKQVDRDSEVAYCAGSVLRAQNIVRPARITQQAYVLCGGRSIINTALFHPTLPLILTAGIMSEIGIHSAAPLHALDLKPKASWETEENVVGGTRPRLLLPPSRASLMEDTSDYSTDDVGISEDEDEEDEEDEDRREEALENESRAFRGARHGHISHNSTDSPDGLDDRRYEESSEDVRTGGLREASDASSRDALAAPAPARDATPTLQQGTVQDFLSAMRSDPMYSNPSPTPLDLRFSTDHGPANFASTSPSASAEGEPLSGGSFTEDSELCPNVRSDSASETHSYDPYTDDGYASTSADTDSLVGRMYDELSHNGRDEFAYSSNGRMWALSRLMGSSNREQKRMRLFDELLRRDELLSLTAGFRKVPKSAGGSGGGHGFTCGSCEGRIDTDP